ncbi:MAG: FecR family protein [Cyclobacteriaceae bacterium]|nr:FecR family protein [Cyclobacteriaceae bacterium]
MDKEELDNRINQALLEWKTPSKRSKEAIWQTVLTETVHKEKDFVKQSPWRWVAAASIIVFFTTATLFYFSQVNINSLHGEQTSFSLPDGSSLTLNGNSKANYNSFSWFISRSVTLTGEGFFNVKKGSKFSVNTDYGFVTVLGTSFNVIARENDFVVECFTGKVEVKNDKNSTVITKGELVAQSANKSLKKVFVNRASESPNWISGDYSYKNEQLGTVLTDISNHFGIKISRSNKISKQSFTGAWNKSMTIDEVLKIVCLPFSLDYTSDDGKKYRIDYTEL